MTRPFPDVLRMLANGKTLQQLQATVDAVVKGVLEQRKVGEITLKIKVRHHSDNVVMVEDNITAKVPQPARPPTMLYADEDGGLNRQDPRQQDLPLKAVQGEDGKPKAVEVA